MGIDSSPTPHYSGHAETNMKPALLPVQGERGAALHPIIPASSAHPARLSASPKRCAGVCNLELALALQLSPLPLLRCAPISVARFSAVGAPSPEEQSTPKTPEDSREFHQARVETATVCTSCTFCACLASHPRDPIPASCPMVVAGSSRASSQCLNHCPRVGRFQLDMSHSHKVLGLRFAG